MCRVAPRPKAEARELEKISRICWFLPYGLRVSSWRASDPKQHCQGKNRRKRLRKTTLQSYELNSSNRTNYASSDEKIAQDSPEGDVTLPAEFSLQNGNELVLLNIPTENTKIIVVRRVGQIWNDSGKTLSNSNTDIARFLRSTQVDLPR